MNAPDIVEPRRPWASYLSQCDDAYRAKVSDYLTAMVRYRGYEPCAPKDYGDEVHVMSLAKTEYSHPCSWFRWRAYSDVIDGI